MRRFIGVCISFGFLFACNRAAERKVLGGIDGEAYCKAKGAVHASWKQTPGQFEGKKTWGCESSDGSWQPFSIGVACTQQYKTTAHAEQERPDDPLSWVCVEGAYVGDPKPFWNRANF